MYEKTYDLRVVSGGAHDSVVVASRSYALPTAVNVSRSKEYLPIKLITDSTSIDYVIKAKPSPVFLLWNLAWVVAAPVAYLVDYTSPKSFYYGRKIYLGPKKVTAGPSPTGRKFLDAFFKPFETRKGQWNFSVGVPQFNSFYFKPYHQTQRTNSGLAGISIGTEYYYRDNRYLSLQGAFATNLNPSLDETFDTVGRSERMYSTSVSLTNNHKLGRFHIGYGLNYSWNTWHYSYFCPRFDESYTLTNKSFGLTANAYYQIARRAYIGVVYKPSLLQISPVARFQYESLISVDVCWKFWVRKRQ